MNCTSCKSGKLVPAYLDELFPCHTCKNCGGNFVLLDAYLRWLESNRNLSFVQGDAEVEVDETQQAMICPKTGSIMLKYRISKNTEHRLDLSPSINAIWMDKGEWDLIKREGLAGQLHAVFTDAWQKKIRNAKTEDTLRAMYEREFGENYGAVREFRNLVSRLPNKAEIIAYLVSDNPYRA